MSLLESCPQSTIPGVVRAYGNLNMRTIHLTHQRLAVSMRWLSNLPVIWMSRGVSGRLPLRLVCKHRTLTTEFRSADLSGSAEVGTAGGAEAHAVAGQWVPAIAAFVIGRESTAPDQGRQDEERAKDPAEQRDKYDNQ